MTVFSTSIAAVMRFVDFEIYLLVDVKPEASLTSARSPWSFRTGVVRSEFSTFPRQVLRGDLVSGGGQCHTVAAGKGGISIQSEWYLEP